MAVLVTDPAPKSSGPQPYHRAARACGKCSARFPILGVSGRVHKFWRWVCPTCAVELKLK